MVKKWCKNDEKMMKKDIKCYKILKNGKIYKNDEVIKWLNK